MTILPLTAQSSCWNETGPKLEPLHRTSQYKFLFIGLRIEPENSFNQWIIPPHHTTDLKSQTIMLDGVFPIGKVNWSIQEVVYGKLYRVNGNRKHPLKNKNLKHFGLIMWLILTSALYRDDSLSGIFNLILRDPSIRFMCD